MHWLSLAILIVCWILWAAPFLLKRAQGPGPEAVETAPVSRLGIILEAVAFAVAWKSRSGWVRAPALPLVLASMLLAPMGVIGAWWSVRHLGKQWRFEAGLSREHELVRSGPYRIVRHPIYASMLAMLLATGFLLDSWWQLLIAVALFIAGTEIRVRAEEKLLEGRFGEQFLNFKRRVPAYIPFAR